MSLSASELLPAQRPCAHQQGDIPAPVELRNKSSWILASLGTAQRLVPCSYSLYKQQIWRSWAGNEGQWDEMVVVVLDSLISMMKMPQMLPDPSFTWTIHSATLFFRVRPTSDGKVLKSRAVLSSGALHFSLGLDIFITLPRQCSKWLWGRAGSFRGIHPSAAVLLSLDLEVSGCPAPGRSPGYMLITPGNPLGPTQPWKCDMAENGVLH